MGGMFLVHFFCGGNGQPSAGFSYDAFRLGVSCRLALSEETRKNRPKKRNVAKFVSKMVKTLG